MTKILSRCIILLAIFNVCIETAVSETIVQSWQVPTETHLSPQAHAFSQYIDKHKSIAAVALEFQPDYRGALLAESSTTPGNFNGWSFMLEGRVRLNVNGASIEAPFSFTDGGVVNGPDMFSRTLQGNWNALAVDILDTIAFMGSGTVTGQLSLLIDKEEFAWSRGGSWLFTHRYGGDITLTITIVPEPSGLCVLTTAIGSFALTRRARHSRFDAV